MINSVLTSFVGAFAALLILAEIQHPNRWLRYLIAFVVGILLAVLLGWLLQHVLAFFHQI